MIGQSLLALLLISLSSARLTRLIVSDKIMEPFRSKFLSYNSLDDVYEPVGYFGYLIHCNWCAGLYAIAVNSVCYFLFDWYIYVTIALSAAYLQGLLNSYEK